MDETTKTTKWWRYDKHAGPIDAGGAAPKDPKRVGPTKAPGGDWIVYSDADGLWAHRDEPPRRTRRVVAYTKTFPAMMRMVDGRFEPAAERPTETMVGILFGDLQTSATTCNVVSIENARQIRDELTELLAELEP